MARKSRLRSVAKIGRIPKRGPINIQRAEFDAVLRLLGERGQIINALQRAFEDSHREFRRDLDIQFKRIAQLQAELDQVKRAWAKITPARV